MCQKLGIAGLRLGVLNESCQGNNGLAFTVLAWVAAAPSAFLLVLGTSKLHSKVMQLPNPSVSASDAFASLAEKFLQHMPGYKGFDEAESSYALSERAYKDELAAAYRTRFDPLLANPGEDDALLHAALVALLSKDKLPSENATQNLIGWRTISYLAKLHGQAAIRSGTLIRDLLRGPGDVFERLDRICLPFFEVLRTVLPGGGQADVRSFATLLLMLDDSASNIFVRIDTFNAVSQRLRGRKLLAFGALPSGAEYREVLGFVTEVRDHLAAKGWPPRDMIDVQGFIWVTGGGYDGTLPVEDEESVEPAEHTGELQAGLLQAACPGSRRLVLRLRPKAGEGASLIHLGEILNEVPAQVDEDGRALLAALEPGDVLLAIHDDGTAAALGLVEAPTQAGSGKLHARWHVVKMPRRVTPHPAWRYHALCEARRDLISVLLMQTVAIVEQEPTFHEIAIRVQTSGLLIEPRLLRRYHAALRARGFAVLAGLSGAGKTWLTRAYADAIGARYLLCAVAPNWTGPEDLLGHLNPLTGVFQATAFTQFLDEAGQEWMAARDENRPARSFHLVLDEMNLARVEHYFARFLSAMEVRTQSADGCATVELGPGRTALLTPNLRFVGTVNVDETTHGFSDKVFDRAQLVEMEAPRTLIAARLGDAPHAAALLKVWDAVQPVAPFAFRVVDDVGAYLREAALADATWQEALDEQVLQKVLPRLRGNDPRVGIALKALQDACAEMPLSRTRAAVMAERLAVHGFASFF